MILKVLTTLLFLFTLDSTMAQGINCTKEWVCGKRTIEKCEANNWGVVECKPTVVDDCRERSVCDGRTPPRRRCQTEWTCGKRMITRCENTMAADSCKKVFVNDCRDEQICSPKVPDTFGE